MQSDFLLFFLLLASGVVFLITDSLRTRRKRLDAIRKNFGHLPHTTYKRTGISKYWSAYREKYPDKTYVDDLTWNDLGMEDVFDCIDVCQSAVGQDFLYALLHKPCAEPTLLAQREALIHALSEEAFRVKTQMLFAKLGKCAGANPASVLFDAKLMILENPRRFFVSALLPLLAVPFLFLDYKAALALFVVFIAHNIWLYLKTQKLLEHQLESLSYLMATLRCGRHLAKEMAAPCPAYAARLENALMPVKNLGVSTAALASSPQSELAALLQVFSMITLLPILQYCKTMARIQTLQTELQFVYELIGEVDTAAAILSYRESIAYFCTPTFAEDLRIEGHGVVHPLLAAAVPNDACIRNNWLLTGSNASGKSTFIKAMAVNSILAQTIHTCTAQSYCLKPAAVISSMAIEDSIVDGESYFIAEIKSMQRIVALADSGIFCYCFIDEILKGTNTLERIAASHAVLRHLHCANCLCVAATHDIELTAALTDCYQNFHFCEQLSDIGISFDYKLKQGPSTTRNAIRLLEYYNFPQDIIAAATAYAQSEKNAVQ